MKERRYEQGMGPTRRLSASTMAKRAGLTVSVDGVAPHAQLLMGRVLPEALPTDDREHELP